MEIKIQTKQYYRVLDHFQNLTYYCVLCPIYILPLGGTAGAFFGALIESAGHLMVFFYSSKAHALRGRPAAARASVQLSTNIVHKDCP